MTGKLTIHHNIAMAATFDIQIPREWQYYMEKCFYMALLLNVLKVRKTITNEGNALPYVIQI
jgi:hypothetical protein